ncbi:hypothetical protein CSZ94_04435 [Janthinobacterium sp. ROICE36]|nr:hypothetical protein CSZ94_04435 [Janthinobacterium sp. ROICE36]
MGLKVEIELIKTLSDYEAALREIESLMSSALGTPEGNRLALLATLVEAFETEHFHDLPATGSTPACS